MISLFIKNTEENNENFKILIDSIREVSPKETINICDNNSKSLLYINELQNDHFKKYKYANNKTKITFAVNNVTEMVYKTCLNFPQEVNYWFTNSTNFKLNNNFNELNNSHNDYVLTLHSNNHEERFEIFRLPNGLINSIKEHIQEIKQQYPTTYNSAIINICENDNLIEKIKNSNIPIVSLCGNYYNKTNLNSYYFGYIGNENN